MDRSSVASFASLAASSIKELWGESVTIGGVSYTAAVGVPPFEGRLVDGGETFSGEMLVSILKTDLATAPALQTEVTARGRVWIVERVTGSGVMATWNLRCSPKN